MCSLYLFSALMYSDADTVYQSINALLDNLIDLLFNGMVTELDEMLSITSHHYYMGRHVVIIMGIHCNEQLPETKPSMDNKRPI